MKIKIFNVEYLLWLALALALAGSLKHLAHVFASVDGDHTLGWVQAVAIDTGVFALAYSIRTRRATGRTTRPLWFGVTLFAGISVYGNLAYGLLATESSLPPVIRISRPYILAASLPILVLFLAELLSDDRQHAQEVARAEARRASRPAKKAANEPFIPGDLDRLEQANERRFENAGERRERLLELLDRKLSQQELSAVLGVSLSTIKRDLATLNGRARMERQ
jgi:hypothetical protein